VEVKVEDGDQDRRVSDVSRHMIASSDTDIDICRYPIPYPIPYPYPYPYPYLPIHIIEGQSASERHRPTAWYSILLISLSRLPVFLVGPSRSIIAIAIVVLVLLLLLVVSQAIYLSSVD